MREHELIRTIQPELPPHTQLSREANLLNTKLANILFTRELARRMGHRGLVAHCFHPGVVRSGFAQDEPGHGVQPVDGG